VAIEQRTTRRLALDSGDADRIAHYLRLLFAKTGGALPRASALEAGAGVVFDRLLGPPRRASR
jgi:hypothetical protein